VLTRGAALATAKTSAKILNRKGRQETAAKFAKKNIFQIILCAVRESFAIFA